MSFTLDLKRAIKNTKEAEEKIVRGTLFGISNRIIKRSPVGNPDYWQTKYKPKGYIGGSFRAAWQASLNSPDRTISTSAQGNGEQPLAKAMNVLNGLEIGQTFYLTNPLPYAMRLEFGWSRKQAPKGMVRVSVAEHEQISKKL